jgi:hypothetical protein
MHRDRKEAATRRAEDMAHWTDLAGDVATTLLVIQAVVQGGEFLGRVVVRALETVRQRPQKVDLIDRPTCSRRLLIDEYDTECPSVRDPHEEK